MGGEDGGDALDEIDAGIDIEVDKKAAGGAGGGCGTVGEGMATM